MTMSDRIRNRREELGMTQDELAKKLGYKSRSSVNKVENSRNLSIKKAEEYAKALDCTPAYLLGWEDEEPEIPEYIPEIQILVGLLPKLTQSQRESLVQTARLFATSNSN